MRISFDIDDTLVCRVPGLPNERGLLPHFIHRWFGEPLRPGTRALIKQLKQQGCSVWIYTTSVRTPFQIRRWLLLHGICVDRIVNEKIHRDRLFNHKFKSLPSKYPPAFGIDLHVDDSEGVRLEGETYGFQVLVIQPNDGQWTEKVLKRVEQAKAG